MRAQVYVTLKPAVLDPQGQATRDTLVRLGFEEVAAVRIGKYVEIELDEADPARARERVEEMCRRLVANTVIETFRIEIAGADGDSDRGVDGVDSADGADGADGQDDRS